MTTVNSNPATSAAQSVTVNIYDNAYQLRGTDPAHIQKIADIVDSKMRAVAQRGTTVDSLRVAVLAALNIADEMLTMQMRYEGMEGRLTQAESSLQSRANNLSGLLDSVLETHRRAG
jgi:cell division protein ZapA